MKKKAAAVVLASVMAASIVLGGCGSKTSETGNTSGSVSASAEPTEYTAKEMLESTDYDVNDYVKLGKWKKIKVEVDKSYEMTDENIKEAGNNIISSTTYYEEVDDAAAEKDKVNIDFEGKMNGETFDNGSSSNYDLVLGSGSFIDGFESGLVGHKAGETVTLDLTFPSDYEKTDLAGKPVTFTVKINKVSRPAEMTWDKLTDDYVADNFSSRYGLTTVKDFKDRVNDSMQSQLDVAVQKAYLEKLVEESEVTLPDGLLDKRIEKTMNSYETTCQQYGMTVDDYIQNYYGKTVDEYKESLKEDLTTSLKEELVLEALVGKLKVKVTADEFNSFVSYYAKYYGMTEDAFIEECGGKDYLVLNYAEYYQALVQAAKKAKVTYVDNSKTDSSSGDTSATAE